MSEQVEWVPRRIVVQGTGYVGLPAALLLADAGFEVIGVDIDENVVNAINEGVLTIDEEELRAGMEKPTVRANLTGAHEPVSADVFIIAVPTPLDVRSKTADLSMLSAAVEAIVDVVEPGNLVIVESTIPPGTCRNLVTPILERNGLRVGTDIELAHCPERILPGNVFEEIVNNDRIIGSTTERGRNRAKAVYAPFVKGELFGTDDVTAELAKLAENASRDVGIAFANELSEVALGLGADPVEVISLANRHPRVEIMTPGIGVGGHCIPIDPWFITEVDPTNSTLIFAARQINAGRPALLAGQIRRMVSDITDPRILLVGATYKPNTEDKRESPALEILSLLEGDGYDVAMYDPLLDDYSKAASLADAAAGAHALCVLVPHTVILDEIESSRDAIVQSMADDLIVVLP